MNQELILILVTATTVLLLVSIFLFLKLKRDSRPKFGFLGKVLPVFVFFVFGISSVLFLANLNSNTSPQISSADQIFDFKINQVELSNSQVEISLSFLLNNIIVKEIDSVNVIYKFTTGQKKIETKTLGKITKSEDSKFILNLTTGNNKMEVFVKFKDKTVTKILEIIK